MPVDEPAPVDTENMDDEPDLRVAVSGVFSLPAAEGDSQAQAMLTREDMLKELPSLKGMPVRIEHGPEIVGEVEEVHLDEQDRIAGTVRLNRDIAGRKALQKCRSKEFTGFSLGLLHKHGNDAKGMPIIKEKVVLHVALAKDPEFDEHTLIHEVGKDRPEVTLGAAALRARSKLEAEKQKRLGALGKGADQGLTRIKKTEDTVSLSSKNPITESETMSAEDIQRQIEELQAKKAQMEQDAQKEKTEETPMQTDEAPAKTTTTIPAGMHDGVLYDKPPNPNQTPVIMNFNMGSKDPLSQMASATNAELDRQRRDAELYRQQFEQSQRKRGQKRRLDEDEAFADTDEANEVRMLREQVERLQAQIMGKSQADETEANKAARTSNATAAEDAHAEDVSDKTQSVVDSITKKLAAPSQPATNMEEDEDEDVEDKVLNIDASKITSEMLDKEGATLKETARKIYALASSLKKLSGSALQHKKDELEAMKRKYNAECQKYTARQSAWITRQFVLANEPLDDATTGVLADFSTATGGLKLKDLDVLRSLRQAVTVSHKNMNNSLEQANSKLEQDRIAFQREQIRQKAELERQRVQVERAQSQFDVHSSDPRTARGARPTPRGRARTQPKTEPAPTQAPPKEVDPRMAYLKNNGFYMPLATGPAEGAIVLGNSPKSIDSFVKPEMVGTFRPPRARWGAQRMADEKFLREMSETRRQHQMGQPETLDRHTFSGHYRAPGHAKSVEGNPHVAMLR